MKRRHVDMWSSLRLEAVGLLIATLVIAVLTISLWQAVVVRWVGAAALAVLVVLIGNRLFIALQIGLIRRYMEPQAGVWACQRLVTARLPQDAPEFDTGEVDSVLFDLLVEPETGSYTIQSDLARGQHTVRIYANSTDLLAEATATLMRLFEGAGATVLTEAR